MHTIIVRTSSGRGKLREIPIFPDVYDVYATINHGHAGQHPRSWYAATLWLVAHVGGHA